MSFRRVNTRQKLWDCSCGRTGNLGVDHPTCPGCGAPKDPNKTYFPPEGQGVPSTYKGTGPNWVCLYCGCGSPSTTSSCSTCGAPKGSAPEAARQDPRPVAPPQIEEHIQVKIIPQESPQERGWYSSQIAASETPAPSLPASVHVGILLALGGMFVLLMTCLVWTEERTFELTSKEWSRVIYMERLNTIHDEDWCSRLPSDARDLQFTSRISGHHQIYDGQEIRVIPESCKTSKGPCKETCKDVDHGDSSFSTECHTTCPETEICTPARKESVPIYHEEPVYSDYCHYTVDRWQSSRDLRVGGSSNPSWPTVGPTCGLVGCEREGRRREFYTVTFSRESTHLTCDLDERLWAQTQVGDRWRGEIHVMAGAQCRDLKPASGPP